MTNKESIENLLLDIKKLEELVYDVRDVETFPTSFFENSFKITHGLFCGLHDLERLQLDKLKRQAEEHQRLMDRLLTSKQVINEPQEDQTEEEAVATETPGLSLNDILEKRNLSDFRKAFSLNDRFRFRRELFGGSEERMNSAINDLNMVASLEESLSYLKNKLNWNMEDAPVADFIKLLEKRFS